MTVVKHQKAYVYERVPYGIENASNYFPPGTYIYQVRYVLSLSCLFIEQLVSITLKYLWCGLTQHLSHDVRYS